MTEERGLRRAMAWIHGWLGLLAGWLLFAMFLTGTASYFRPEITQWMQPEYRVAPVGREQAVATAIGYLQRHEGDAAQWYISLPDDRSGVTSLYVQPKENAPRTRGKRRTEIVLDPATGQPVAARETQGGEQFYRFHFQLQLPHPWGRWLAGVCAIFMLTAIISGVITHKRIFADFFLLRWNKGQRSWLDAHNVSAVLALPYHAMITYTGLITLVAMYMPWPIVANYHAPETYYQEAFSQAPEVPASGKAGVLAPVVPMVRAAEARWAGGHAGQVVVRNPGDAASVVTVYRDNGDRLGVRPGSVAFAGLDGRTLFVSTPPGPAIRTASVMLGLHMAQFAPLTLRWIYFLLGLSGAAMVGTGLLLWTAKRRRPGATPFFGFRLVERLNVAAVAALPGAMAAYLLANRLIPAGAADRADTEVATMFWTWGGLALFACLRPIRRAWIETLAFSAALFAAVPLINALTTDRGLDHSLLTTGDGLFRTFDLTMIAFAVLLGFAARRAARVRPPAMPRRRSARTETTELVHAG